MMVQTENSLSDVDLTRATRNAGATGTAEP
jgi:hypothetical protein